MSIYVCLQRAVNVGGTGKLPIAELKLAGFKTEVQHPWLQ